MKHEVFHISECEVVKESVTPVELSVNVTSRGKVPVSGFPVKFAAGTGGPTVIYPALPRGCCTPRYCMTAVLPGRFLARYRYAMGSGAMTRWGLSARRYYNYDHFQCLRLSLRCCRQALLNWCERILPTTRGPVTASMLRRYPSIAIFDTYK
jgi:hypothetical protein